MSDENALEDFRSSLPNGPIPADEFDWISELSDESVMLSPGSVLTGESGPMVTTIRFDDRSRRLTVILGYSPTENEWVPVGAWDAIKQKEEVEEAIDEWAREEYGEEAVEHGRLDL